MSTWHRLTLPPVCERLLAFSVPREDHVLIVSYEGTHVLRFAPEITVERDDALAEYDIYDSDRGIAVFRGVEYAMLGLHGGEPLLTSPRGERLELDTETETLSVMHEGRTVFSTRYQNFSGDWAAATFSPDGRYIVLGCPYDFDFAVWVRAGDE